MQIEKPLINDCLCVSNILKTLQSNYLGFCSNLHVKFAVFLKCSLLFNSFFLSFSVYKKTLWLKNLKAGTAMNVEISVFVGCVETIIHLFKLEILVNQYILNWYNLFVKLAYLAAFLFGLRISVLFNGLWISLSFPIQARPILELQVCSYQLNHGQDQLDITLNM